MRLGPLLLLLALVAALAAAVTWYVVAGRWLPGIPAPGFTDPAVQAQRDFCRNHPGEKPLNWLIGKKAQEFHRLKPMGRFRLHKNDCSDYVDCIVDDALGAKARFRRHSDQHILSRTRGLWDIFYWDHHAPLLPGDIISVEHSPHYEPYEGAIWHVGVIGADGRVYDWSKLRSWPSDRYGCNTVGWFTQHTPGPRSVIIWRLKAVYRYRARPIPLPQ
jgi:hypothetical protein